MIGIVRELVLFVKFDARIDNELDAFWSWSITLTWVVLKLKIVSAIFPSKLIQTSRSWAACEFDLNNTFNWGEENKYKKVGWRSWPNIPKTPKSDPAQNVAIIKIDKMNHAKWLKNLKIWNLNNPNTTAPIRFIPVNARIAAKKALIADIPLDLTIFCYNDI